MKVNMVKDLIEFESLDEYGQYITDEYPNVRFVFEIHFTRADYTFLKEHFKKMELSSSNLSLIFFKNYFKKHPTHRLLFLMLLTGFIRYEYLNSENSSNFFNNFMVNGLQNDLTSDQTFRQVLINYFFRWRGGSEFKTEGLYLYDTQTSQVSLKLEEAGHNQYLNSFILHAGGVAEIDLHEYSITYLD